LVKNCLAQSTNNLKSILFFFYLTKLTDKQREQKQDRRIKNLEKQVERNDRALSKLEKRASSLEKQVLGLKKKI